jgi:ketosteroid isomerase-like protein
MKHLLLLALVALTLISPAVARNDEIAIIEKTLDDFHDAASKADGKRYFDHFARNGIFLGTDIRERWTVEEFKAYAEPHFSKGKGWTYHPERRHVYLSDDQNTAWFDEILTNKSYGKTRGSGVLIKQQGSWKIAQYHLTLPVPNALIDKLVEMIEKNQTN